MIVSSSDILPGKSKLSVHLIEMIDSLQGYSSSNVNNTFHAIRAEELRIKK